MHIVFAFVIAEKVKLKFAKNFTGDKSLATMLLYSGIGKDENGNGISGEEFAHELYYLQDMGVKNINVRINSPGGSVIEGFSIFSAICHVKCNVETYIDGMAASIAGVIAMAGKKVHMSDIGMLMIHDPSFASDEPQTAKDKEILNLMKNSLVTTLTNKTNFDPVKMGDMMTKETWMDCSTAKSYGFVDEIFSTNVKENIAVTSQQLYQNNKKIDAMQMFNKFKNLLTNTTMKKVANLLKLTDEASEESIAMEVGKIQTANNDLVQKVKDLEAENVALKAKVDAADVEKTNAANAAAEEVVNQAVTENKIKETEKADWLVLAKSNLTAVKNSLATMGKSKIATKVTDAIATGKKKAIESGDDRSTWSYRDYEKKAPKDLEILKNEDPETYKALYESHVANIRAISAK